MNLDLIAFGFAPGPMEMMIILVIAVLLFGKKLPEVGRSLGKGIVEFKRGVSGVEDEIHRASSSASVNDYNPIDDHDEAVAPKFEPPKQEEQSASETV